MFKNIFLGITILLLLIYFSASFLYDQKYVLFIKPLIIPCFFGYAYHELKSKINQKYVFFILFFYVGESCILYMNWYTFLYPLGLLCYFFSYLCLVLLVLPYINTSSLIRQIGIYPVFTFLLIISLLIFLLDIIFDSETIIFLNLLIVLNALSAILLSVIAFIYLQHYFFRKSIFYFFGSFSIFFSDILSALEVYYLENIVLNITERFLHFFGFYLIYLFYIENSKNNDKFLV